MVLILDDEHLESLQCSRCHKYLSMFPVKNHSNHYVTCGRCSRTDADEDDSVRSTLYELVANEYLFRCVNRYEGCKRLLRADETEDHETKCVGNGFSCPKCKDAVDMSILELIWHYKLQHLSSYLKEDCFDGKLPNEDVMLYVQDDIVFFIFIRCDSNVLNLCVTTLTEAHVTQEIEIKRGSLWEKTEKTPCKLLSTFNHDYHIFTLDSIESIQLIFNLKVSKRTGLYNVSIPSASITKKLPVTISGNELFPVQLIPKLKKYFEYKWNDEGTAIVTEAGYKLDVTCSNCKKLIGSPVFMCTRSRHQICYSCRTWCGVCDSPIIKSCSNDVLLEMIPYLRFPCKWKCGGFFTSNLRDHERVCELRIKECPKCSSVVHLKLMKSHLFSEHKIYFLEEYDADDVMDLIYNDKKGSVYYIINDKWCFFLWELKNDQQYTLGFGLSVREEKTKLSVAPSNFNITAHKYTELIAFNDIFSCKPYLSYL